jgi:hypothetical protein
MSQSPPLSLCRVSLAKCNHLIFALLISCVHVISLSLSSGDVDGGYLWEVQTPHGWTPYWDPSQV